MTLQNPSPFLRQALLADATTSAAMGLLLIFGASWLAEPLGLARQVLMTTGMTLIPFAAFAAWLSLRPAMPRAGVWAVIIANIIWAADSLLVLATTWIAPTTLGQVMIVAQALAVALYAELQFIGLKRSQTALA